MVRAVQAARSQLAVVINSADNLGFVPLTPIHPIRSWMIIDEKVDGALPLEEILSENPPLREMIKSMKIEKKWLFTNAGKAVSFNTLDSTWRGWYSQGTAVEQSS